MKHEVERVVITNLERDEFKIKRDIMLFWSKKTDVNTTIKNEEIKELLARCRVIESFELEIYTEIQYYALFCDIIRSNEGVVNDGSIFHFGKSKDWWIQGNTIHTPRGVRTFD